MQRENQKDRSIVCKYDPTEPGDYRIEVRWSGEHVPGSPFNVMIFDTQEELGRFVQVILKYIFLLLIGKLKTIFAFDIGWLFSSARQQRW